MTNNRPSKEFPVIIAGAGPCGLVAALTLKQEGVPFVVVERTQRATICSNAGSGFDLAASALEILTSRLNMNTETIIRSYSGIFLEDMNGSEMVCMAVKKRIQCTFVTSLLIGESAL